MSPQGLLYVPGTAGSNLSDAEFNHWYDNEHVPARMAIPSFQTTSRWSNVGSGGTEQSGGGDHHDKKDDGDKKDDSGDTESIKSTDSGDTESTDTGGHPPYDKKCCDTPYLAIYEIDTCEVLSQAPYNRLAALASEREKDVMRRIALLDRRTYDLLEPEVVPPVADYDAHNPGPYLITMEIEVDASLEDNLNRWYREEHIPLLAQVPGWRRSRRYVLRDAGPAIGSDAERVVAEREGRLPKYLALHEWESLDGFETPEFKRAISTPERMRLFEFAKVWGGHRWKLMKAWA